MPAKTGISLGNFSGINVEVHTQNRKIILYTDV